ncbi:hypothetical protein BDV12DRAFT_179906 [Aspergillus spectabilis]
MPPRIRHLLRGEITLEDAQSDETNILHQLRYVHQRDEFFSFLEDHAEWIREVIAHHFNISPSTVIITPRDQWLNGSFNVCIPVSTGQHDVLFRIPLPYRVGERVKPGNADEKIRCEAGTYAWLEEHCPDIPIAKLYGFGLSTGVTFTRVENLPFASRYISLFLRWSRSLLYLPVPSRYVRNDNHQLKKGMPGYLIIEFINRGSMLSNTWGLKRDNNELRANLFRDLARIFLSFARVPLSRIGSFIICDNGYLRLANRPLSLGIQELENEGIPVDIPRSLTYSSTHAYVTDLLAIHDSRLYHQPNAINDQSDFTYQASILATMRMLPPLFFTQNCRGPFFFFLTDLHQSNIFVDKQWRITALIDLEWGCTLPVEMIRLPYRFAGDAVDEVEPERLENAQQDFMTILKTEERNLSRASELSGGLEKAWGIGAYWYGLALATTSGLFWLFDNKIHPLMTGTPRNTFHFELARFWTREHAKILAKKLDDRASYDSCLRQEFEGFTGSDLPDPDGARRSM